jgi:hypothetical protein
MFISSFTHNVLNQSLWILQHEQHCEDLSFWLEAQQYRDRSFSNDDERVQYATTIFELFMTNNASFKISVERYHAFDYFHSHFLYLILFYFAVFLLQASRLTAIAAAS